MSGHKIEDVAKAATGPLWYQLYLCGGRGAAEAALERARIAGFKVVAITVDTGTFGFRERDVRNGAGVLMGANRFAKIPFLPGLLAHPGWFAGFIADGMFLELPNIVPEAGGKCLALSEAQKGLANSVVTWSDLKWLRKAWPGPIVVKGVLTSDDARRSIDEGAAGVVVSNHGGRQLDSVAATLRALPEIVSAVGSQAEVLMDGGIRRGGDIVKALCLGARAVLVGRAYAYGLGAAGTAGASRAVEILRADLQRTMALLGCESLKELNPSYVEVPANWPIKPR
jgi:L-lactate dehydrogenase (cytochrome)